MGRFGVLGLHLASSGVPDVCTECGDGVFALRLCDGHYTTWRARVGLPFMTEGEGWNDWGERQCRVCQQWLLPEEFPTWQRGTRIGRTCLSCGQQKSQRKYQAAKRQREVAPLLELQQGRCANPRCRSDITGIQGSVRPRAMAMVDHDHNCCPKGRRCEKCTRGLLCRPCNLALGLLGDDAEKLRGLASYLDTWSEYGRPPYEIFAADLEKLADEVDSIMSELFELEAEAEIAAMKGCP